MQYFKKFSNISFPDWKNFGLKLKMLIRQIKTFDEIFRQIIKLEKWQVEKCMKKDQLKVKLDKVGSNNKKSFGFLKNVSKEQELIEIKTKLGKINEDLNLGEELSEVLYTYILEKEIPDFRNQKKNRLDEILNDFSSKRIEKIWYELFFWKALVEMRLGEDLKEVHVKISKNIEDQND